MFGATRTARMHLYPSRTLGPRFESQGISRARTLALSEMHSQNLFESLWADLFLENEQDELSMRNLHFSTNSAVACFNALKLAPNCSTVTLKNLTFRDCRFHNFVFPLFKAVSENPHIERLNIYNCGVDYHESQVMTVRLPQLNVRVLDLSHNEIDYRDAEELIRVKKQNPKLELLIFDDNMIDPETCKRIRSESVRANPSSKWAT